MRNPKYTKKGRRLDKATFSWSHNICFATHNSQLVNSPAHGRTLSAMQSLIETFFHFAGIHSEISSCVPRLQKRVSLTYENAK